MTREAIEYFKFHRKIFCEDYLKICPKDSIAYQATLKEKEFYDMAIKSLEKDAPKAPKKSDTPRYGMGYEYYDWCCPSCGKFLAYECDPEREKIHHCRCGQRLKWKESE
jgi:hypothetical protein